MRFGIKDNSIELQGFGRREEQIKIFESLGQAKILLFIELLSTGPVDECSVTVDLEIPDVSGAIE
jgi:hypothetical protein